MPAPKSPLSSIVRSVALVVTSFTAILAADFATGADLALRALYVVPVGLATWRLGRSFGIVVAALGVAACVAFDLRVGGAHREFVASDATTRTLVYFGVVVVLDRLRAAHAQLDALAHVDALTGIANVRGFHKDAQRELERAKRFHTPMTVVQIDLDGFKSLNDTRGHAEGDLVLTAVARVLRSGRALDIAARVGGDEFVLLLPDTPRPHAERVIARVRERLTRAMRERGWPITFSIGVATFLTPPESLEGALRIADGLMYEVKHAQKDAVRFAEISEPRFDASMSRRASLGSEARA